MNRSNYATLATKVADLERLKTMAVAVADPSTSLSVAVGDLQLNIKPGDGHAYRADLQRLIEELQISTEAEITALEVASEVDHVADMEQELQRLDADAKPTANQVN